MKYRYVVLGAGRQGVALAYDLAAHCEAQRVVLADSDPAAARRAVERLRRLLPQADAQFEAATCDVADLSAVTRCMRGAHVVLSAVPYRFNVELTKAAIAAGAHFNDLGGNTGVVREQLAQHAAAASAGVSVVPDCGLAPGLGNLLAAHGIAQFAPPISAHVRCGGLPERPVGPLGYKLLFHFQGLINEYSGFGEFLRDGRRIDVPALTELETIDLPEPLGRCEAAVTSGGTSTCPESFAGRVRDYDYKTIRYPGHFAIVRALFELGCFEERIELPGGAIEPKAVLRRLMEARLQFPEVRDVTVLRATVTGREDGAMATRTYELIDHHDERTGFTAMERTTAFPTSLVAYFQARGLIEPGARPLELCLPLDRYLEELKEHDIRVRVTDRGAG